MLDSQVSKKSAVEDIETKVKRSKDELKDLTVKHGTSSKELIEKQNEYEIAKNKLELQIQRCEKLTEENRDILNKASELERQKNQLEKELATDKEEFEKLNREIHKTRRHREALQEEISGLERNIIYRDSEIERLKQKAELHARLLESMEDYSQGIQYIVKDRNEKDADIIIDKLQVDDKFKAAIEAALGEISNYLIVNNEENAARLIDILNKEQKGKVTFIIRDNLYKNTLFNIFQDEFPEILNQRGVYGWADRFIKCKEEYWLLFRYLLDEYIIVEDLETARKLSKDNFIKFITLDGDIVTNSFVRAGGKTAVESLKLGREKLILEFRTQIRTLETSLEGEQLKLDELKKSFSIINTEPLEAELSKKQTKVVNIGGMINQLVYEKDQTNLVSEANSRELEELNTGNNELKYKIDGLISEIEKAENTKYQREKEIDHFASELENLADNLTAKRDEYNTYNIEITKTRAEFDNLEKEIIRIDENIVSKQNSLKARALESNEYELEIRKLGTELESFSESGSSGWKPNLKALLDERAGIETEFSYVRSEYEVKKSLVDRVEHEQRSLRTSRDDIIEYIHKNEMQLTKDRIEIKEHKDRIKDEYEVDISYSEFEDNTIFDFIRTKAEIDRLRNKLRQLGGSGQLELGIYEQEKAELERMTEQKNDLVQAEKDLIQLIDDLNKTAQQKFTETFELIRQNFMGIFRELFMEGDEADLRLVIDPENPDPLDAKIDIIAKPRGKRPQLIDLLSGGEKTLTAIALLFAIYQVKPSPFCILDEVDAPLDDANIDRFIKIIRKFSSDTQFIIVTHNKRTMEAADSMYGVTMAEQGISTIVNVKFNDPQRAAI
jgi:chromosome segregation protein